MFSANLFFPVEVLLNITFGNVPTKKQHFLIDYY